MKDKELTPEDEARLAEIAEKLSSQIDELGKYINSMPDRFEEVLKDADKELKKEVNNNE